MAASNESLIIGALGGAAAPMVANTVRNTQSDQSDATKQAVREALADEEQKKAKEKTAATNTGASYSKGGRINGIAIRGKTRGKIC